MTEKYRIYPVFLPHAGCPYRCVYCNQFLVTRTDRGSLPGQDDVIARVGERLNEQLRSARASSIPGEVAFYGGTFTSLPKRTMAAILDACKEGLGRGLFTGIRFSTRPDSLSREVCTLLRRHPVKTVELGVQSFSDDVLQKARRNYTSRVAEEAAYCVKENGWALGIQLMAGLPGDTRERFLESTERAARLNPQLVRFYPTLVLEGTTLATWYRHDLFRPLTLEDAVSWCAQGYAVLKGAGVPLARAGLHAGPELERPGAVVAGPRHPSFGYLVRARWWRDAMDRELATASRHLSGRRLTVFVPERLISEAIGHRRANVEHWKSRWSLETVRVSGRSGKAAPRVDWELE